MVLELNQTQLDMFAEAYDAAMRGKFSRALEAGIDPAVRQAHANGLGAGMDAALDELYGACDELGPADLESFVVHAVIALEPPKMRETNAGLFDWIDMMMARDTPPIDQKLSVIRQHLRAIAETDQDASRMAGRIDACLGVKS